MPPWHLPKPRRIRYARWGAAVFAVVLLGGWLGCQSGESHPAPAAAVGPRYQHAPGTGDLPTWIASETQRLRAAGSQPIVYVGAKWCEPCEYFRRAVEAGELTEAFPRLVLLDVDLDENEARLRQAGYNVDMIPLFALPNGSGHMGPDWMAGSIKGPGAVDNIVPRLRQLLGKAPPAN